MAKGRRRKIERLHRLGLKAPGGRPPRLPYWLRQAIIREAPKEFPELDVQAILAAEPSPTLEMTEHDELACAEHLGTAILLSQLQAPSYRSEPAIVTACYVADISRRRTRRGDRERTHLDELIEAAALC